MQSGTRAIAAKNLMMRSPALPPLPGAAVADSAALPPAAAPDPPPPPELSGRILTVSAAPITKLFRHQTRIAKAIFLHSLPHTLPVTPPAPPKSSSNTHQTPPH